MHYLLDKSISELRSAFQKSESQVEELEKKSTVLTKELDQVKCMTSALGLARFLVHGIILLAMLQKNLLQSCLLDTGGDHNSKKFTIVP